MGRKNEKEVEDNGMIGSVARLYEIPECLSFGVEYPWRRSSFFSRRFQSPFRFSLSFCLTVAFSCLYVLRLHALPPLV